MNLPKCDAGQQSVNGFETVEDRLYNVFGTEQIFGWTDGGVRVAAFYTLVIQRKYHQMFHFTAQIKCWRKT